MNAFLKVELPEIIKSTYILAIVIVLLFVGFIIFVVLIYNRKQLLYLKENQLKESVHQNQLLQKELEKQKLIEEERERISHDMHDDLGAGISALKLQAEFLKLKIRDPELQADLNELLKTSAEMSISMREMLWSLNAEHDTLGGFTEYAKLYAQNFLKKTTILLDIKTKDIVKETVITTEQRRNLFLCLKEALNNAYKHSRADRLHLSFSQDEQEFTMEVSDNGIGIGNLTGEGNGLGNMKRRMQEQKGHCEISTENGTHLFFRITL